MNHRCPHCGAEFLVVALPAVGVFPVPHKPGDGQIFLLSNDPEDGVPIDDVDIRPA